MNEKTRILYKNIYFVYSFKSFDRLVKLTDIKAFFLILFQKTFKSNSIKYLLASLHQEKKEILVLLQLNKKPDWSNVNHFTFENVMPQISNCLSPCETHEELTKKEFLEYGISDFVLDVSNKKFSEQRNFFHNFIRGLRDEKETRESNKDEPLTFEESQERTYKYLRETKSQFEFKSDEVDKILVKFFATAPNHLLDETIRDFSSFIKDKKIDDLMHFIKSQVRSLKNNDRPRYINIQGSSGIGKTELTKAILKYLKIKFNIIAGKIRFEPDVYDDNADVDIYDDSDYFRWFKNDEGIDYVKAIVGCNHKGQQAYANKFKPFTNLNKNKLSIIICNQGSKSFQTWINSEKNPYKIYISEREGFFIDFGEKPLYKSNIGDFDEK